MHIKSDKNNYSRKPRTHQKIHIVKLTKAYEMRIYE